MNLFTEKWEAKKNDTDMMVICVLFTLSRTARCFSVGWQNWKFSPNRYSWDYFW